MQRASLLTVCLLCLPCFGGCIFPYSAYPTLDYTPAVKLGTQPGEVRAFRVDITKMVCDVGVTFSSRPDVPGDQRLREIPVTNTDEVAAQVKPSVTFGLVIIGGALNFLTHTSHSVAVRLYRPGFELAELKSWERVNRIAWQPAADLDAREKVLDTLLPLDQLEAGSEAATHRDALLFGAGEYDRLAAVAPSPEQRGRLREKAGHLRKRAKE
ncbi:MAG: hypothetical protein IID44_09730 [Planctomycetes bacterium]|nr:hypothetical protein [Planctomycetota bacterium]